MKGYTVIKAISLAVAIFGASGAALHFGLLVLVPILVVSVGVGLAVECDYRMRG